MTGPAHATLHTPVGPVAVTCGPAGVTRVGFGARAAARPPGGAGAILAEATRQLAEYFSRQRQAFDLPLDWSVCSPTQHRVLAVLLASVRFGETVTYGDLATRAGLGGTGTALPAQVAGQVMGSNPFPLVVPCHRVVARSGLGGYSGGAGTETKRWLLTFEGAIPATLDWDPAGPDLPR